MNKDLDKLTSVKQAFTHWRATRLKQGKIPDYLWAQVHELLDDYSPAKICGALQINYAQIKENLTPKEDVDIQFIEVTPVRGLRNMSDQDRKANLKQVALQGHSAKDVAALNAMKANLTQQELKQTVMMAAEKDPKLIPELLKGTSGDDKKSIFLQANNRKENLLMLCLKNKSSSLDTLFNEISTWDNPNKKKLLQQVNQEGDNVLVIAAEKGPEKLEQVFKLINQLNNPKQELWSLLKNHSTKILNASKKSPQIIPTLLKYCSKLDTADQQTFYQTRTENLLCMIGLCELKMQELLDELAAKETEFEMRVEKSKLPLLANLDPNATPNQKAHFSIHSIHKTLKSSLDTYQSSNKEPADAHTLKNSWDATLNDKQLSPILKENRASVGKIIGKLLLALSIIGLGYFIYEKIQKNKKGQGFFETNSAHLLKKLSGQVEQLDKTREQEDPNKSFPLA